MSEPADAAQVVADVIRNRKTKKVLASLHSPLEYDLETLEQFDAVVHRCIQDCGWAPFHYDRNVDGIAEPWRVYQMSATSCRQLAKELPELIPTLKPGNKMPALLSGCGCLTLFTWLPVKQVAPGKKLERVNREHLAATAAAIQNYLLLLTANKLANYWASGTLIEDYLFDRLGISNEEVLSAAVFVHYPKAAGQFEVVAGKQRARRCPNQTWLKQLELTD